MSTLAMSIILLAGCSSNTSLITKNYTLQWYNNNNIILITPTAKVGGFNAFYASGGITSTEYKNQLTNSGNTNCTVINGTYFGTTTGNQFEPAGEFVFYNGINTQETINSTINPTDDINLGVHVTYKNTNNESSFNEETRPVRWVWFWAGPMIIEDGEVNRKLTEDTSHRNTPYSRTFMIQLADHTTVLWISKAKTKLSDLGAQLNTIFKGQIISVVNLDGGPSTALENDKISVNTQKKLPLWFSICEKK